MHQSEIACPVTKAAKLLSDTWTMLIIHDLLQGDKRFCELERSLVGSSTRTLSNKLKKLESERLIQKNEDGSYKATKMGEGIREIEKAMRKFGELYL